MIAIENFYQFYKIARLVLIAIFMMFVIWLMVDSTSLSNNSLVQQIGGVNAGVGIFLALLIVDQGLIMYSESVKPHLTSQKVLGFF